VNPDASVALIVDPASGSHDRCVSFGGGPHERGLVAPLLRVGIGAAGKQRLDGFEIPMSGSLSPRRAVERRRRRLPLGSRSKRRNRSPRKPQAPNGLKRLTRSESIRTKNARRHAVGTGLHRDSAEAWVSLGRTCPVHEEAEAALDVYFKQCSITVTCRDLAMMAATLSNLGRHPVSGRSAYSPTHVTDMLSIMFTCGMYDYSGQWAYRVGVPATSGSAAE
jgi:hypothetical protein